MSERLLAKLVVLKDIELIKHLAIEIRCRVIDQNLIPDFETFDAFDKHLKATFDAAQAAADVIGK